MKCDHKVVALRVSRSIGEWARWCARFHAGCCASAGKGFRLTQKCGPARGFLSAAARPVFSPCVSLSSVRFLPLRSFPAVWLAPLVSQPPLAEQSLSEIHSQRGVTLSQRIRAGMRARLPSLWCIPVCCKRGGGEQGSRGGLPVWTGQRGKERRKLDPNPTLREGGVV